MTKVQKEQVEEGEHQHSTSPEPQPLSLSSRSTAIVSKAARGARLDGLQLSAGSLHNEAASEDGWELVSSICVDGDGPRASDSGSEIVGGVGTKSAASGLLQQWA